MSTSLQFFQRVATALTRGPVAIATVIHTNGSTPREVGAKLMLASDGDAWGTIGGGAGEAKVLRQAQTVLQTGQPQTVAIDLSGAPHREIQGICGGHMQVWVARWQGERAISIAQQIVESLTRGTAVTLTLPLNAEESPTVAPVEPHTVTAIHSPEQFQETLLPSPLLLIVGAGHCGIQLAQVAHLAGFRIMVQDERPEWASPDNFPQAEQLFHEPIGKVMGAIAHYSQLYAALVTRGIDYDLPALQALITRQPPCTYLGMIGSQKRVTKALQALQSQGIDSRQIPTLHAPIGLDIGALTPEEIAISICSELIMVRRGGTGQPLSVSAKATLVRSAGTH
ncbi:XdhC family protein [Leptolyngbya iicbica]|uniref:XdhC/CoxI family protein n=2 Tax=Cyanophyceae TaxID=3028117 RepID=A0A4Q7EH25_9CYAN|nr:XdhC/CoxI family protein [Leptolyngbya sp. LK]RZM82592.1 XdhC/CoxI family protein [Leptolyngbya sp. LK]